MSTPQESPASPKGRLLRLVLSGRCPSDSLSALPAHGPGPPRGSSRASAEPTVTAALLGWAAVARVALHPGLDGQSSSSAPTGRELHRARGEAAEAQRGLGATWGRGGPLAAGPVLRQGSGAPPHSPLLASRSGTKSHLPRLYPADAPGHLIQEASPGALLLLVLPPLEARGLMSVVGSRRASTTPTLT